MFNYSNYSNYSKNDQTEFCNDMANILNNEKKITFIMYSTHDLIYKINNITFQFENHNEIPILSKIKNNLYTCNINCCCNDSTCICKLINITVEYDKSNNLNNIQILITWNNNIKLFSIQ